MFMLDRLFTLEKGETILLNAHQRSKPLQGLGRTYLEVREISAGGVPNPETDQSFLAVA